MKADRVNRFMLDFSEKKLGEAVCKLNHPIVISGTLLSTAFFVLGLVSLYISLQAFSDARLAVSLNQPTVVLSAMFAISLIVLIVAICFFVISIAMGLTTKLLFKAGVNKMNSRSAELRKRCLTNFIYVVTLMVLCGSSIILYNTEFSERVIRTPAELIYAIIDVVLFYVCLNTLVGSIFVLPATIIGSFRYIEPSKKSETQLA